jgi:hypothetical protein
LNTKKIRRITRARDKRADIQIQETIEESDLPPSHADTHSASGSDTVTPSSIGAETPAAAQTKADAAESNANDYTDIHEDKDNPHSGSASDTDLNNHTSADNPHGGSQVRQGGTTANRPSSPDNYDFYFDTDLGQPIWYDGSGWVDSTGTTV